MSDPAEPAAPTAHQNPPNRRVSSLVLVNTGDGKGKSTAAFGVIAAGRGARLAGRPSSSSSSRVAWQVGRGAGLPRSPRRRLVRASARASRGTRPTSPKTRPSPRQAWAHAKALIGAGEHRLVVLDEITYPMTWGWIDGAEVVATIADRPRHVHVICTGRDAPGR